MPDGRHHQRNSTPAARRRRKRYSQTQRAKKLACASSAKYYRSEKGIRARQRRADRKRRLDRELLQMDGFDVREARNIDRPRCYWMDTNGTLHREDTASAEEVIRRWQTKEQQRANKTKAQEAPQIEVRESPRRVRAAAGPPTPSH